MHECTITILIHSAQPVSYHQAVHRGMSHACPAHGRYFLPNRHATVTRHATPNTTQRKHIDVATQPRTLELHIRFAHTSSGTDILCKITETWINLATSE